MSTSLTLNGIPVKDKLEPDLLVKVSVMKEIIKPTRPHRHANYHELIFLSQGAGFHEVDGHEFEVTAPECYYLRPGQTHCWNFSSIPGGFVVLFREDMLKKEDIDLLYRFPAQIPLEAAEKTIFELTGLLHRELKSGLTDRATCHAYLYLLITKLQLLSNTPRSALKGSDHVFQRYKRLVNDHFTLHRELFFYADQLHITTAVLNEACKKAVGKTPARIINERVLLEAKLLLTATNKSIQEVAADLGFADSPHFIKFFKQNTNLTPRGYRDLAATTR